MAKATFVYTYEMTADTGDVPPLFLAEMLQESEKTGDSSWGSFDISPLELKSVEVKD